MRRCGPFALALLVGVACGDPVTPGVPAARVGAYVLDSLDAAPLPGSVTWNGIPIVVVADTLVLTGDGGFSIEVATGAGQPTLGVAGTAAMQGDSLFLREAILGSVAAAGVFTESGVHLQSREGHPVPGHEWRYRRLP